MVSPMKIKVISPPQVEFLNNIVFTSQIDHFPAILKLKNDDFGAFKRILFYALLDFY